MYHVFFCYSLTVIVLCVQSKMSARGGKKKATKLSRSARAGVIFPVGRMMRYLRTGTHKYRIGMGAPVYMAAVIEYLAGSVLSDIGFTLCKIKSRIDMSKSIFKLYTRKKGLKQEESCCLLTVNYKS